jgi:uncharacterized protein YndB with AHSA1/START domain
MKPSAEPVIVEQDFEASVREVWNAITQVDKMRQWFFPNIPSFEASVGFRTAFDIQSGKRNFRHLWRILEVVPEKLIKYHWSYEEYPGEGLVTFELSSKDNLTRLRLTNEGMETFPRDIPEFSRDSCESGWKFILGRNLKEFLEKH